MKIFFCLKTFLPNQVAGTEIYVAGLAKGLMQKGHDVAVVKPNYESKEFTTYDYEGIKVLEYPESSFNDKDLQTGKKFPEGISAYEELLKKEQPDAIHFHEISGSNGITIQHLRIAVNLKIRVFTTFHLIRYVCKTSTLLYKNHHVCDGVINITKCAVCTLHQKGLPGFVANIAGNAGALINKLGIDLSNKKNKTATATLLNYPQYIIDHKNILNEIFELSEKVFVLNNWFSKILLKNNLPGNKILIVPQALPYLNTHLPVPTIEINTEVKIRLVYVGRICKIKGLDILLKAFNAINKLDVSLDIYGKVTEENFYQDCLALTKNNKQINWKGIAEPGEIIPLLKNYDLLIFPAMVQEMSPFITLEAFAAGIPVLASDIYANREEIIEGKNGWLYKFRNMLSLQNKLKYLLENSDEIKKAKGNIPNIRRFDKVVEKHIEVYHSFLESN